MLSSRVTIPLATKTPHTRILKAIYELKSKNLLVHGFKGCVKKITNSAKPNNLIFACSTFITHFDLIAHFPILCENYNIPFIFVNDESFTVAVLDIEDQDKYENIRKYCKFNHE